MMDYPQDRIQESCLPRIIRIAGIGIGLALVLAYCIEWLAGPTLVIFEWDSGGYVHIALILNQGADLDVRSDRTFGYPLFLALVLRLSASFVHVPTAQMLFVAGAALLAAIAISVAAPAESRNSVAMALLQAGLSVLAVVGLLSYQPLTNAAHELIPEALYTFLATAALLLTSLVLLQRYPPPISRWPLFCGHTRQHLCLLCETALGRGNAVHLDRNDVRFNRCDLENAPSSTGHRLGRINRAAIMLRSPAEFARREEPLCAHVRPAHAVMQSREPYRTYN